MELIEGVLSATDWILARCRAEQWAQAEDKKADHLVTCMAHYSG
jgi:hypothetical protein